eukprot:10549929-Lingulodinium_polyedra.AAC.1
MFSLRAGSQHTCNDLGYKAFDGAMQLGSKRSDSKSCSFFKGKRQLEGLQGAMQLDNRRYD